MRIWLACFFLLFALAELFDWLKHISLPLPIYILGGAFLAIASNFNKHWGIFFDFLGTPAQPPSIDPGYPTESISSSSKTGEKHRLEVRE